MSIKTNIIIFYATYNQEMIVVNGLAGQNGVNVQQKISVEKDSEVGNDIAKDLLDYLSQLVMSHVLPNMKSALAVMVTAHLTSMCQIIPLGFASLNNHLSR